MSQKKHKKRKQAKVLAIDKRSSTGTKDPPPLRPEIAGKEPDYGTGPYGGIDPTQDEHGAKVLKLIEEGAPQAHVMIGVPTGGNPKWEFCHDLCNLIGYTSLKLVATGITDLALSWVNGCYVACNRNDLVQMAKERHATHILFLDDDMRFPPWALEHLLMRQVPIIGANYTTRKVPIRPISMVGIDWDKGETQSRCVWTTPDNTGMSKVEAIGGGVTLIDMGVFEEVGYPYFEQYWDAKRGRNVGEDIDFCKKALDAGIPVLIDHDLSHHVRHIGEMEHRMDLAYEAYQQIAANREEADGLGLLCEPEDGDSGLAEPE